MNMFIYVRSPYRGDINSNVNKAKKYCRFVIGQGKIPIAPHLYFPQFLSEEDERDKALQLNLELLNICTEMWVFGNNITEGMKFEIERSNIPIKYFNEKCIEKFIYTK